MVKGSRVQGQLGLHSETLYQKRERRREGKKNEKEKGGGKG
jgi:hypothetical protein